MCLLSMTNRIFSSVVILIVSIIESYSVTEVTYGSSIALEHVTTSFRLYSTGMSWGTDSGQIVTAIPDSKFDVNQFWLILPESNVTTHTNFKVLNPDIRNKVISGGATILCNSIIRLRHSATDKYLHSSPRPAHVSNPNFEVYGYDTNTNDQDFQVECLEKNSVVWEINKPVALKNVKLNNYLVASSRHKFTQRNCPNCPIVGHQEVSIYSKEWSSHDTKSATHKWIAKPGLLLESTGDTDEYDSRKDEL